MKHENPEFQAALKTIEKEGSLTGNLFFLLGLKPYFFKDSQKLYIISNTGWKTPLNLYI